MIIDKRKVEGFPGLVKDMTNSAVINTDTAAFKEYSEKKLLVNTVLDLKRELAEMKNFINRFKTEK